MRATNLRSVTGNGSVARANGTSHASSARPVARKRSTPRPSSDGALERGSAVPTQQLSPFAAIEAPPKDAQMWPVHSVVWLQPELMPELPGTSGLRIECHYKVPAPDLLHFDVTPNFHPGTLDRACDPLPPRVEPPLPQNDLEPLGWDPRSSSGFDASLPLEGRSRMNGGLSPDVQSNHEPRRNGSGQ